MQNIHPLVVHFPIALLMSAAGLMLFGVLGRSERLLRAACLNLWLGTIAAAIAVRTGLAAEETAQHTFEIHQLLERHEALGLWVLWLSVGLALVSLVAPLMRSRRWQWVVFAGLVVTSVVLSVGAHYGGRMVYEHGVGTALVTTGGTVIPSHEH